MGVVSRGAAARVRASASSPDAASIAWLAAPACAVVTALVVHVLGPSVGAALLPFPQTPFLPGERYWMTPEPTESARYLLSLGGPVLLAGAIAGVSRRPPHLPRALAAAGVVLAQAAFAAVLIACFAEQRARREWLTPYFNVRTLVVAAIATIVLVVTARRSRAGDGTRGQALETAARRRALAAAAALLTAVWLLPGVHTATSIDWAYVAHDMAFYFDETFAVLNGLTPRVDFNAQYASLQPYLLALAMLAFGKTLLVFTIAACAISLLAMLAIYGVLRRVTGSATIAFALYLPFMATSLFVVPHLIAPLSNQSVRFTAGTYFAMLPLRYAGPFALAWLVTRHLRRAGAPPSWPLFAAAGLVVIDNLEFGVAAFGATVAALLWTTAPFTARRLLRLAGAAAIGSAVALALLSLLGLVRAQALPDLASATSYARLYGVAGYYVLPLAGLLGLPLVIYLTYVAAIATATVRAVGRAPDRALTGMLAWVGVFGLGSAPYYVARSWPFQLPMLFPTWTLALALLAFVALRHIAAVRRFSPMAIAPLFGIGLAICSLAQVPAPWVQLQRLERAPEGAKVMRAAWSRPLSQDPVSRVFYAGVAEGRRFVVEPGAAVALLITTGHYVADAYGVRNVVPYTGPDSLHTFEQLDETVERLRAAGGNTFVMPRERLPLLGPELRARGFALLTYSGPRATWRDDVIPADTVIHDDLVKLVDASSAGPAGRG